MKYESTILKRLIDTYGVVGNPHYISEIIKEFIVQGKECYPDLFTYQSDWLAHIDEFGLNPSYTVSYTGQHIYAPNTKEKPIKGAILKGSTKYRDIDTGEVLDAFEDGRNLELVSVKTPVLTTSNEDGTKTNILTTPSDLTLRGIGDVQDTLDCLTGELIENTGIYTLTGDESFSFIERTDNFTSYGFVLPDYKKPKGGNSVDFICNLFKGGYAWGSNNAECIGYGALWSKIVIRIEKSKLSTDTINGFSEFVRNNTITVVYPKTESIKKVDLTIHDKDQQKVERLTSFEGGTHFATSSQEGSPLPTVSVEVVTDLEETLKVCSLEGNTM